MEFKKEFILREIVGEAVLIPTGATAAQFNGLMSVNELGKFIWENYERRTAKICFGRIRSRRGRCQNRLGRVFGCA